ncbi:MAG TPA: hypothetical protein VFJ58_04540, partial [Armatimonadota bacterium]|nr:hypothetical protein [Armatimonadota bacterium]
MMTTLSKITAPVSIAPHALTLDLLLTARTPISHHDPDNHDKSNISLFNRAKHLLFEAPIDMTPHPSIDHFLYRNPVPEDMADLFANLDIPAFVATAALKLFADIYNHGDGEGIFEGMERWDRLFSRSKTAAVRAHSLRSFWDVLTGDLQVGMHDIR